MITAPSASGLPAPALPEPAAPGSYPRGAKVYPSLHHFAWADPRRIPSRERDFGLRWLTDPPDSPWRAAWVEATGELYVVQSGDPADGGGHVEVLGVAASVDGVSAALAGWGDRCGEPGSLNWLRRRCLEELGQS